MDGLTATRERESRAIFHPSAEIYGQSLSHKKRGVYVVEFIGNGISSRPWSGKEPYGYLKKLVRLVMNSDPRWKEPICDKATRSMTEYATRMVILIPFSNNPGQRTVILRTILQVLARFNHLGENYNLQVGFHMDRESIRSEKYQSFGSSIPSPEWISTSLKLLEEIQLVITSYDHDNQPTRMEVPIEKLDRGGICSWISGSERTHRIETFVEAKARSSRSKKVNLDNFSISINGIDQAPRLRALFFIAHRMDLFWKSGAKMGTLRRLFCPLQF